MAESQEPDGSTIAVADGAACVYAAQIRPTMIAGILTRTGNPRRLATVMRPVRINTDEAAEIARLYGIGPELAKRIVDNRRALGPFTDPTDLARVPGVSLHLAETLDPHIVWEPPPASELEHVSRDIPSAVLSACCVVLSWYGAIRQAHHLGSDLPDILVAERRVHCLAVAISLVTMALWAVASMMASAGYWTTRRAARRRFLKSGLWLLVVGGAMIVMFGAVNAIWLILYCPPRHRLEYMRNPVNALALVWFTAFLLGLFLYAFLLLRNSDRDSRLGTYLDAFPLVLVALFAGSFAVPSIRTHLDPGGRAFPSIAFGVICIAVGAYRIRFRGSYFDELTQLVRGRRDRMRMDDEAWLRWARARLPDHHEREAMFDAIRRQQRRGRVIVATGLIAIGGWALLTVFGSVIDRIVQTAIDVGLRAFRA